jgi:hypothetical protein
VALAAGGASWPSAGARLSAIAAAAAATVKRKPAFTELPVPFPLDCAAHRRAKGAYWPAIGSASSTA